VRIGTAISAVFLVCGVDSPDEFCYPHDPPDASHAARPAKPFDDTQKTDNHVQVLVRDNNVDQALRALKKKLQREGVFREMKLRGHYEKPSEKKAREKAEAVRRARKLQRKKLQREGLLPAPVKPKRP